MKIYTRTGDEGETGLFGGPRVRKDNARIEAYGTVDELNAFLGLARCETLPPLIEHVLEQVQADLFSVGAELATPEPQKLNMPLVGDADVTQLELAIDALEEPLQPLRNFILPGGTKAAATLHVARGVCRRAERWVVHLGAAEQVEISPWIIRYLNRLSDYLFVAARYANYSASVADVPWQHR
ncbi:ATP/cobalamin adenosyltransferase [Pirellula staleyi DSM 6068]|uniref:Corrinoid adenosyltransferase n=1 Tax=Pirellula staleyi (strain ATCC 27377 / DSM 6068 / ICPB 4128) TaxID=530564 RepID=D2R356_PIRSD|nr:cob(I)yrinic acid a,c-diamide adenosyltransferase [Pirellula staleyi]ADB18789.1 ATP/cobalamin adenosyltransferase [Pirellula staleyi DSM 6068]